MGEHNCIQLSNIAEEKQKVKTLQGNYATMMKEMREGFRTVNKKIDRMSTYIFEGGMEDKFSTKEEVSQSKELQELKNVQMQVAINSHQAVINKLAWSVIIGVITFVGSSSLIAYSFLNK